MNIYEELAYAGINLRKHNGTYGIEYEAEFTDEYPAGFEAFGFNVTVDGSLRGYGYEFITKGAKSREDVLKQTAVLFDSDFYKNCYYKSSRASTHVHRNIQQLTHEELIKFLLVYYLVEPVFCKVQGDERDDNYHCLSMHQAEGAYRGLQYVIDKRWHEIRNAVNEEKYTALNLCNIGKLGTVEFRVFPSTKNVQDVADWLHSIETLFAFAATFEKVEDIWKFWVTDRRWFALKALGKTYHQAVDQLGEFKVGELLDMNYSQVFAAFKYYDTRELRAKKKPKINYVFRSEQDIDLQDHRF